LKILSKSLEVDRLHEHRIDREALTGTNGSDDLSETGDSDSATSGRLLRRLGFKGELLLRGSRGTGELLHSIILVTDSETARQNYSVHCGNKWSAASGLSRLCEVLMPVRESER